MAFPNNLTNPAASAPGYQSAPSSALSLAVSTVVKASAGTVVRMSVVVGGAGGGGGVFDCASTAATAATANQVAAIPTAPGVYEFGFPCLVGITVVPGTGQTVSVSYA